MAKKSYGDWIRSNPPLPTKEYQKKHMAQQNQIGDTSKMVTAVEWYAKEHHRLLIQLENKEFTTGEYAVKNCDILQQAKQMEKEQIVNAHLTGLIYPLETDASLQAEEYYEQTFKK